MLKNVLDVHESEKCEFLIICSGEFMLAIAIKYVPLVSNCLTIPLVKPLSIVCILFL